MMLDGFAFRLFRACYKGQNLFLSPHSVFCALAMVHEGARGRTRTAIEQALGVSNPGRLFQTLPPPPLDVQLRIANSLWLKQDYPFHDAFVAACGRTYRAQANPIDFGSPVALDTINGWVREKTEGKIESILSQVDQDTRLVLLNAIYFLGFWTEPFDPAKTRPRPFAGSKHHPMMEQGGTFDYFEDRSLQAIRLPYGRDERLSMFVFLPSRDLGLDRWCETLSADAWKSWRFESRPGQIVLPKFKMEIGTNLNDPLAGLGLAPLFDATLCDLSGMSPHPLVVSQVLHKAMVDVHERGTEAAAVTAVAIATGMMPIFKPPFRMVVDRPFFFLIRDDHAQVTLFLGAVTDP
jgi:serpin B